MIISTRIFFHTLPESMFLRSPDSSASLLFAALLLYCVRLFSFDISFYPSGRDLVLCFFV